MKWFVFLIVLLTFTRDVRAQDDDDMGKRHEQEGR